MIYELKEWIISFFLNKAHFFRKLFCKEYIRNKAHFFRKLFCKEYIRGGSCKKRYAYWVGFLDCCYEKCPKRKEGGNE